MICDIIINTFYLSDKILSNKYIYDIKGKLQLTTNVDVGIHVTPFLKIVNKNLFVHLKLVLKTQYTMLLNYV